MGACASALKGKKDDVAAAPAPELLKEEVPAAEVMETTTTPVKEEFEDKKVQVSDKDQPAGTLLVEDETPKEAAKEDLNSEPAKVEISESKAEALPVSEQAGPVTSKTEETSTVTSPAAEAASAAAEEKKTEA